MPEEKDEIIEPVDPSTDLENEKTEVSLDFDDDTTKVDDDTFEVLPIDETEVALELEKESVAELSDRLLRLQAEFDNYRKRMNQRFADAAKFASEEILLKLLDVLDNLERSLDADFQADPSSARVGVQAIHQQLLKIFTAEEVRPIESLGKEFDPYYQNSINTTSDEERPDKLVVEEYMKGYMIRDRVLRPASVCVNRHTPPPVIEEPVGEETTKDAADAISNEHVNEETDTEKKGEYE
ncbi:MAG: nucleotide exchange factor GrpE [Candidatus Thorarchaeota archaeon]